MAAYDLTTRAAVKEALKIQTSATQDDAFLDSVVTRVSDSMLRIVGMVDEAGSPQLFDNSTVLTKTLDGTGSSALVLPHKNVKQVNNLWESLDYVFDGTTLIAPADYVLNKPAGIVHRKGGAPFLCWPQSVKVQYVLNWAAVPEGLAGLAIRWVGYEWNIRQNQGVASKTLPDGSVVFHDARGIPKWVTEGLEALHLMNINEAFA